MRYCSLIINMLALTAVLFALAGCPTAPGGVTVTVTPPNAVVEAGQIIELSAASSSPEDTDFAWESSNENVAVVEAVKSAGVVLRAVAPGTAVITATANVSGAAGSATISVPQEATGNEGEGEGEVDIPEGLAPGLHITVNSVTIPEDRKPVVAFEATDDDGNLIALSEFTTFRFALAYLNDAESPQYVNYVVNSSGQASYDGAQLAGLSQSADGSFTYKFKSALPADYDDSATHQLGGQVQREYAVDGVRYTSNPIFTFRPDSQAVTVTREISSTQVCNSCHTQLEFHGGARREFQLCILCHTAQTVDPESGNTVDMVAMVHKIHMGKDLPSGNYEIIGHGGEETHFAGITFPQDIRNCATCHRDAPDADNYLTKPSRLACGSCHDTTWFGDPNATPDGHHNHPFDFEQPDDSACATCHKPSGGVAGIADMHSTELSKGPGLALDIVDTGTQPAGDGLVSLSVDFTAADGSGAPIEDLAAAGVSAGLILAWPSPEYEHNLSESVVGSDRLVNHGGGAYTYTFENPFTLDSTSYAVAMQGRVTFTLDGTQYRQGTSSNGFRVITLDGVPPVPRRHVVSNENCGACHGEIRGHGEQRFGVEVCVMCHHVNQTDLEVRDDSKPWLMKTDTVTVNFKDMIHRIHTGEELNRPYTVAGYRGSENDFTEVRFPGKRQQCSICHVEERADETATWSVPLPGEALATVIDNETTVTTVAPARAACTSCHDHLLSDVHAVLMTDQQGNETCAVCHGAGRTEDVQMVHRLDP